MRTIMELEESRGSGASRHAHPWTESYVITEGTVEVTMDDNTFTARPGYFFQIPAGTSHGYRVVSERAKFVITLPM